MNEAEIATARLAAIRAALAGITGEDQSIEDNIDLIRETLNTRVDVWRKQAAFDWLEHSDIERIECRAVETAGDQDATEWDVFDADGNRIASASSLIDAIEAAMRAESEGRYDYR